MGGLDPVRWHPLMLGDSCYWQALQENGPGIRVSGSKGTRMQNQPAVCPPNPTYMNSTVRSRPTLRQVTKHCCMDKKPGGEADSLPGTTPGGGWGSSGPSHSQRD